MSRVSSSSFYLQPPQMSCRPSPFNTIAGWVEVKCYKDLNSSVLPKIYIIVHKKISTNFDMTLLLEKNVIDSSLSCNPGPPPFQSCWPTVTTPTSLRKPLFDLDFTLRVLWNRLSAFSVAAALVTFLSENITRAHPLGMEIKLALVSLLQSLYRDIFCCTIPSSIGIGAGQRDCIWNLSNASSIYFIWV